MNTDPLAIPGVVKLHLTDNQALELSQLGVCFVAIAVRPHEKAAFILPCQKDVADAACLVAMGRARAIKAKKQTTP